MKIQILRRQQYLDDLSKLNKDLVNVTNKGDSSRDENNEILRVTLLSEELLN